MSIRRNKRRFAAEMSVSSLNDIMFFLLLFFLIVSTVVHPTVLRLTLPRAEASQDLNKKVITIDFTKDKEIFLNNSPIAINELEQQLVILLKGAPEPTVLLRADNSLTIQDMVDVLQIGIKVKAKMVLATKGNTK